MSRDSGLKRFLVTALAATGLGTCGLGSAQSPCCESVTNLGCAVGCQISSVALTWVNPMAYSGITIARDGAVLASLNGTQSDYYDVAVPNGVHTYSITGACGSPCGAMAASSECIVNVAIDGFVENVVWAAELMDQIDSVAALESALDPYGMAYIEVSDLAEIPCVDACSKVFCMTGTYPDNHPLSQTEGLYLRSLVMSGVSVYFEGSDTWGFDPPTPFAAVDGVDDATALDGDDSFTAVVGLGAAELLASPYLQAQAGSDSTDRISPAIADALGPTASAVWLDGAQGYGTGVVYVGDHAVWCQSWEFGGYTADAPVRYLEAILATLHHCDPGLSPFRRGDANVDGSFDVADPIFTLSFLFQPGAPAFTCSDAADVNADNAIDIADAIFSLTALFAGGAPPSAPFGACGADPDGDVALDCSMYPSCP